MKRFLLLAFCLIPFAVSAAVSSDTKPASTLTVTQIIDKNVAARGGLKAWRAVNTLILSGRMEAGGKKNSELPFVMKMKRSHKSRLEIQFRDQTAVQVYDGVQGWKLRPFLGRDDVEPFTPVEAKAAEAWEELDGSLIDYVRKGTKVALQGTETVDGNKAYKLKLTTKNGEVQHVWVDAKTFLESKIDGQPRKMDGKPRDVAIYYRDYKTENGLTMPHIFETFVEGVKESHKMRIERIAFNQPLDDALFAKPVLAMMASPSR